MDAEKIIDRADKAGNDESDRCALCGCLLSTETMIPDKGKAYMLIHCGNQECDNHKNKRKVYI